MSVQQFLSGVALGAGFAIGSALYGALVKWVVRAVSWLSEGDDGFR